MKAHLVDLAVHGNRAFLHFKRNGRRIVLEQPYSPAFYIVAVEPEFAAKQIESHPLVSSVSLEEKFATLHERAKRTVVRVELGRIEDLQRVTWDARKITGIEEICETNIPPYFSHLISRKLAFYSEYDLSSPIPSPTDSLSLPSLSCASLSLSGSSAFILTENGFSTHHKSKLLAHLSENNIDVAFTAGGEEWLRLPEGMLHIDLEQDMGYDIYSEAAAMPSTLPELLAAGKERLVRTIELSQMSGARPSEISRITPGRLNTYLHMRSAKEKGYLVPDLKREIEKPKTLRMLLSLDKGGTIFYPTPGAYENVAKCDFASMYPNIIVNYNISPEKMHCSCCPSPIMVPDAGFCICPSPQGIIPSGISAVLSRRLLLKKLMKEEANTQKKRELDLRQKALKNILVTCFGYLGFSNFVFSNVECKECVMLYGRHILLEAKELAEKHGLTVQYGMVDSLFLTGGTDTSFRAYCAEAGALFKIPLELDCIFSRIVFPLSRSGTGAANRYFGLTEKGELESRGIQIRRSDACSLVKAYQEKAARLMLSAPSLAEGIAAASSLLSQTRALLREGAFPLSDFIITTPIRKELNSYSSRSPHIVAFMKRPSPDFISRYCFTSSGPMPSFLAHRQEIDVPRYEYLLQNSLEELIRC